MWDNAPNIIYIKRCIQRNVSHLCADAPRNPPKVRKFKYVTEDTQQSEQPQVVFDGMSVVERKLFVECGLALKLLTLNLQRPPLLMPV